MSRAGARAQHPTAGGSATRVPIKDLRFEGADEPLELPVDDIVPNLKPFGACGGRTDTCTVADCPREGTLTKPGRDERVRVRGCGDVVVRNRNNRKRGLAKQTKGARKLGVVVTSIAPSNEEQFGGLVRTEGKSGAKAKPVETAYNNTRAQSDAARAVGDSRPFVPYFAPAGSSRIFYVIRDDELEAAVFALAATFGFVS